MSCKTCKYKAPGEIPGEGETVCNNGESGCYEEIVLNKSNIIGIINAHQEEIDELEAELPNIKNDSAKRVVQNRIAYLQDNQYRYKLQAKAWEMEV